MALLVKPDVMVAEMVKSTDVLRHQTRDHAAQCIFGTSPPLPTSAAAVGLDIDPKLDWSKSVQIDKRKSIRGTKGRKNAAGVSESLLTFEKCSVLAAAEGDGAAVAIASPPSAADDGGDSVRSRKELPAPGARRLIDAPSGLSDLSPAVKHLAMNAIRRPIKIPVYVQWTGDVHTMTSQESDNVKLLMQMLLQVIELPPGVTKKNLGDYQMRIADVDGQPDTDYPALNPSLLLRKFRKETLVLCHSRAASAGRARTVQVLLPKGGKTQVSVPASCTVEELLRIVCEKRNLAVARHHVHTLDSARQLSGDVVVERFANKQLVIADNNTKGRTYTTDGVYNSDAASNQVQEIFWHHAIAFEYKQFHVIKMKKFKRTNEERVLGIDRYRITNNLPTLTKSSFTTKRPQRLIKEVMSCELIHGRQFELSYIDAKTYHYEARTEGEAREIVGKINYLVNLLDDAQLLEGTAGGTVTRERKGTGGGEGGARSGSVVGRVVSQPRRRGTGDPEPHRSADSLLNKSTDSAGGTDHHHSNSGDTTPTEGRRPTVHRHTAGKKLRKKIFATIR